MGEEEIEAAFCTSYEVTVCPIDGKTLKQNSIYRHDQVHSASKKDHECEMCKKKFATSYDLNKHVKYGAHSSRTLACQQCQKLFSRKEQLKEHIEFVHEKKMYSCAICGGKLKKK